MTDGRGNSAGEPPDAPLVRAELDRILASDIFARSERLSSFLRFIVDRTLSGGGESLKEQVIAAELYGKDASFDTAADPIVRIDARRLRDKLREYYASAGKSPLVISVPKGRYTPVFRAAGGANVAVAAAPSVPPHVRRRPIAAPSIIGAVLASLTTGVVVTLLVLPLRRSSTSETSMYLTAELGADASMPTQVGPNVGLSPDGSTLAFVALTHDASTGQLYVRHLKQLRAIPLPGTEDARNPFFSPDGQSIAFFDDRHGKLKRVPVKGGAVATICDAPAGRGGAWLDDGSILVQVDPYKQTLMRVPAEGGTPEPFVSGFETTDSVRWPQVLPGGNAVLYTTGTAGRFEAGKIVVQRVGGRPHVVVSNGYFGRYDGTGSLLYVSHGSLFAAPFDVEGATVTGPPVRLVEGVSGSAGTGGAEYAISRTGMLMYIPDTGTEDVISWMDRAGTATVLRAAPVMWTSPVLSPDGRRLAMEISDGTDWNVWVHDFARDALTKVTFEETGFANPLWTPGGRGLVVGLLRDRAVNLYSIRADGTGEPQRLTKSPKRQEAWSWHPSGKFLTFFEGRPGEKSQLMVLPMLGDDASGWKAGEPRAFHPSPFDEAYPSFSPDGRWIAYRSDETGRFEVFVRPFPAGEPKVPISIDVGDVPQWSPTKKELLFRGRDNRIMVVGYEADGDSFRPEKPRLWSPRPLPISIMRPLQRRPFAVAPDGEHVALFVPPDPAPGQRDKVVLLFDAISGLRQRAQATK